MFSQLFQDVRKLRRVQGAEDYPVLTGDRDHHPVIRLRYLQRKVIRGDILLDRFTPVDRTQRCLHDRHGIVGQQSQAKTKQSRLGIARAIQFSNTMPTRASAFAGWAAIWRQADAMFV